MIHLADSPIIVSGAFFAAAVETLKEFNHLGQSVLAKHNIDSIDRTLFYPNQLRFDLFQAVYERFGDAGLTWVGLESPRQFISLEEMERSQLRIRLNEPEFQFDNRLLANPVELDRFFDNFLNAYCEEVTKILVASTLKADYPVGQFLRRHPSGLPLHYLVQLNSKLPKNCSPWSRGTVQFNVRQVLPEGWDFQLSLNKELTHELVSHSEYFFDLVIMPMAPDQNRAYCILKDRLECREALLKAALDHTFKQEQALKRVHDKTMESIRYAAAVQQNQLPKVSQKHGFKDFAVLWEPKDTIGGDTWWLSSEDSPGPVTLAVIDCTGHGVPGAMTAMLVSNTLTRLFAEDPFCTLEAAAAGIGQALAQSFGSFDKNSDVANGCDLVLIQQGPRSHQLRLGLAGIDVMHYRRAQKTIDWVESPRNGISAKPSADLPMAIRNIDYSAGDRLLITTDGLTDQVGGGERLRSFGYGRTHAILGSSLDKSVHEVLDSLMVAMDTWRGTHERRDDVTLVCIDL
jgi:serine phosphatase RsbU (regulator of sigma subunit)